MRADRWQLAGLAILTLLGPMSGCSLLGVAWEHDYQVGLRRAAETRQRALVEFYSFWNQDCRAMDGEVFANNEVRELLRQFIPVRVDAGLNAKLMEEFGANTLPTFVVIRPDGEVVTTRAGRMDAAQFRVFLIGNLYR